MLEWSELTRRVAAGDSEAKGLLLEPYLGALRAYIRLQAGPRLRAQESVSDLVQSVCREVLADLESVALRDEPFLRRWLFTTAERKLIDRTRRYGAEKRGGAYGRLPHRSWSELDPVAVASYKQLCGPIDDVIAAETQARIENAMRELPPDQQRVILLTRIQGMPHAEVAALLSRSEGAMRVLLSRALARLAKMLDRD